MAAETASLGAFDLVIGGVALERNLEDLVGAPGGIVLSEHLHGDGAAMFRHACALGLEGIVSKRRDAPYRSGRCADWIKVKNPAAPAATRIMEW